MRANLSGAAILLRTKQSPAAAKSMAFASAQNPLTHADGADLGARANLLYSEEHRPLRPGEVWQLFVWSWRFIRDFRRLVWLKALLAIGSLMFFLVTPWPLKI